MGKRSALLILAVTCWGIGDSARAQDWGNLSDRRACRAIDRLLPKAYITGHSFRAHRLTAAHLTESGIAFERNGKIDLEIAYADIGHAGRLYEKCTTLQLNPELSLCFRYALAGNAEADELATALNQLISSAKQGRTYSCVGAPSTDKAELSDFAQKTAAWRTLAIKPALSDAANKQRILAEDAIQNKDMKAAVAYYEAGVTADPTWGQGWYNAALIHAEMKEYADAAYCMKHYLILMPDAPDSQVAKDKVILWDAKAEEARR